MAISLTVEGPDGIGKSTICKSLMSALKTLGAVELPLFSEYLLNHLDAPSHEAIHLSTAERFYLEHIKTNPSALYFIHISEPAKTGIEGFARKVCLDSWFAKILGDGVYPFFYNYSRSVTYATSLIAGEVVPNLILIGDRSGLTTETMQPVDYIRGTLRKLQEQFRDQLPAKGQLEVEIPFFIETLGVKNIFHVPEVFQRIARLTLIPGSRPLFEQSLSAEQYSALAEEGERWWSEMRGRLQFIREWIIEDNERLYGIRYPEYFLIADVPFPFEIGRARNYTRFLYGGLQNFRDLDPKWVIELIADLYRTVPSTFEGTARRYMDSFCPISVMENRARLVLAELIFDRDDPVREYIEARGILDPTDFIRAARQRNSDMEPTLELQLPKDFHQRALSITSSARELQELEAIARTQGPDGVNRFLLEMMGVPEWSEANLKMERIWREHGISREGRPVNLEGVVSRPCEAEM